MAPYIHIAVLLSFLLVHTATIAVQAKVLVPSSSSSTSTSAGRYLQDEQVSQEYIPKEDGSEFGSAISENKNDNDNDSNNNNNNNENDEKTNSPQFVPHPDGTDVRFIDQDGTWYVQEHYTDTLKEKNSHQKNNSPFLRFALLSLIHQFIYYFVLTTCVSFLMMMTMMLPFVTFYIIIF
jgi:hypothetical protein